MYQTLLFVITNDDNIKLHFKKLPCGNLKKYNLILTSCVITNNIATYL